MAAYIVQPDALSVAILTACGIDPALVTAFSYSHELGSVPRIELRMHVADPISPGFIEIGSSYRLVKES